ncbi:hypothetical protein D3C85_1682780 [compost metagenome]
MASTPSLTSVTLMAVFSSVLAWSWSAWGSGLVMLQLNVCFVVAPAVSVAVTVIECTPVLLNCEAE